MDESCRSANDPIADIACGCQKPRIGHNKSFDIFVDFNLKFDHAWVGKNIKIYVNFKHNRRRAHPALHVLQVFTKI